MHYIDNYCTTRYIYWYRVLFCVSSFFSNLHDGPAQFGEERRHLMVHCGRIGLWPHVLQTKNSWKEKSWTTPWSSALALWWDGWNWCSRPSQPAVGCSHHKKNTALGALSTLNRKAKRKSLPKPIPCLGIHRSCSGWATKNGIPVQGKIGIFRNFAWLCRSVWGALTLLQILVQLPNAMLLYSYLIVTSVNSYCLYKLNLLPAPHQGPPHLHLHCPCQAIHLP